MKSSMTQFLTIFLLIQACADGEVRMAGTGVASQWEGQDQGMAAAGDDAVTRTKEDSFQDAEPEAKFESMVVANRMQEIKSKDSVMDRIESAEGGNQAAELLGLLCLSPSKVLTAGEETRLSWQPPFENAVLAFALTDSNFPGTLSQYNDNSVIYHAPSAISTSMAVTVKAQVMASDSVAVCTVQLQADQDLGVADDGLVEGLVGYVYEIPDDTVMVPDFSAMDHQSEIVVRQLNIPNRAFSAGFPGAEDLVEWFGIQFKGRILAPVSGWYEFQVISDDGANLYINGDKVVDNDGLHAVQAREGQVYLEAGDHELIIDYFQGPRYHIALQLLWKLPDMSGFEIIAAEYLGRPAAK